MEKFSFLIKSKKANEILEQEIVDSENVLIEIPSHFIQFRM